MLPDRLIPRLSQVVRWSPWPVVVALAAVLILEGAFWRMDVRGEPFVHAGPSLVIYLVLGCYAIFRALCNEPYLDRGYRAWLATTPWTVDQPLPFGPVELDWPDLAILGAIILVNGTIPGHQSAYVLAAFLFLHALALVPIVYRAANHVSAYAALFGLGLMVKLWPLPWACALTGVVVYLIVYDGIRLTLARFPEPGDETPPASRSNFDPATARCGWPYDQLLRGLGKDGGRAARPSNLFDRGRAMANRGVRVIDALAWGLLLGWWIACASSLVIDRDGYLVFLLIVGLIVMMFCEITRVTIYSSGYSPPISAWGRLLTLRWIIPGYDVVDVGPTLTALVPATIAAIGLWKNLPPEILGPTAIAAMVFTALAAPPGLRRWRLVGKHRMLLLPANRRDAER